MKCKLCGIATKGALSSANWDAFARFTADKNDKTQQKSKKSGGYRMIQFEFRNGGARAGK